MLSDLVNRARLSDAVGELFKRSRRIEGVDVLRTVW